MNFKDLIGQTFGRLTVVSRLGSRKGYASYLCQCSCGSGKEVRADSHMLHQGFARSCGCLRREWVRTNLFKDLVGLRFGRLTVVRYLGSIPNEHGKYLCRCSCGTEVEVYSNNLRKGNTKSCGCLQRERVSKVRRSRPYEALYKSLARRAHRRNLAMDISYEDFVGYTAQGECHYCGEAVHWSEYNGGNKGYNLDRKDNSQGYLGSNIVVACGRCNQGKSSRYSYEEWACMASALRRMKQGL